MDEQRIKILISGNLSKKIKNFKIVRNWKKYDFFENIYSLRRNFARLSKVKDYKSQNRQSRATIIAKGTQWR